MASGYTRICALATGGMASVDVVVKREGAFQRIYAMKRLLPHFLADEQVRGMFLDEARFAGLVRHANVASVLDLGEDEHGPFLVMDYVDGVTLAELLQQERKSERLLPLEICLRIASQIAEGLHAAHELCDASGAPLQLVHRDVSPQNVMLGFDGVVRVMDFGIAKALGQSTRTSTGVLKGKFGYMSPEQLRFEEPDRRSDLFSLGVVLYELLTGKRLYASRDGNDGARRILSEPAPDVTDERADVPAAVVELLFELLAKKRELRPATAREVARRLDAASAELVAAEDPIELSDYLEHTFGERRRERAEQIATLLERSPPAAEPEPRRRRTGRAFAALSVVVGLGLGLALLSIWRSGSAAHESAGEAAPAVFAEVALEVQSVPPGAELFIDGEPRGTTPVALRLPRGERSVQLRLEKAGYRQVAESVVLNVDQRLRYALVARREAAATSEAPRAPKTPSERARAPIAKPAATSKPARDFRRFD